jgi:hypothetical protein
MRQFFAKLLSTATRHLPSVISLFLTFLFFLSVSGYFIEEKSALDKLFAPGVGFFAGMLGGGVLGWLIGGVGVVAMGTGVGVGPLGAIIIGGAVGAIFGGLTGASFSFLQMLRNPGDFDVNWLGISLVLLVSLGVFFSLRLAMQRIPTLMRRSAEKDP